MVFTLLLLPALASAKPAAKPALPAQPTLAVLDLSFTPAEEGLASAAAEALNAELISTNAFIVVERRKISSVLREQALGQAGVISEASAAKVGALVGARLLVTGRLSHIGKVYRLDARIIDSETARVTAARHAEFQTRSSLQLAVREVAAGLADPSLPDGTAGVARAKDGKSTDKGPPDVPADPSKARDAAAELAGQLGQRFTRVKGQIASVDDAGMAVFNAGTSLVFAGMRMEIIGVDDMTGSRARKGYLTVRSAEGGDVTGSTESDRAPAGSGDDVVSLPLAATVTGTSKEAVKALSNALEGTAGFTRSDDKSSTPVRVELELKGRTIGARHIVVRVIDPQGNVQGSFEGTVGL
jgi:curli biogenesis system outer membrane secretion channel CsgG